jgi:E3 ubiquitin-protein ligase HUWE1
LIVDNHASSGSIGSKNVAWFGVQGIGGPQKFQIHKAYGSQQKLPAAHTCFNQLDLVEYESKEQLRDRLMLALHEGATGFGFG